ncbi:MAG: hypothetical protein AAF316_00040 [Cyanobacteria bacterium P01_A01_bin.80]
MPSNIKPVRTESYGYPVVEFKKVPHTSLGKGYNVRFEENVKAVDDILPSIKEMGVKDAIHVIKRRTKYIALDGYRRLHCCDLLCAEEGKESIEVPIIVVKVPEKDIPLYQVLCSKRKGLKDNEVQDAIALYTQNKPDEPARSVADKFATTHTTVVNIKKITQYEELSELYIGRKITQNGALKLIKASEKTGEDILKSISKMIEMCVFLSGGGKITGRHINKAIKQMSPDLSLDELSEKEGKKSRMPSIKTISMKLIEEAQVLEAGQDFVDLRVSQELFLSLQKELGIRGTSTSSRLLEKTLECENPNNLYEIWLSESVEHDCVFVYDSKLGMFVSFEQTAEIIAENLKLNTVIIGGIPALRVSKSLLEKARKFEIVLIAPTQKEEITLNISEDKIIENGETEKEDTYIEETDTQVEKVEEKKEELTEDIEEEQKEEKEVNEEIESDNSDVLKKLSDLLGDDDDTGYEEEDLEGLDDDNLDDF